MIQLQNGGSLNLPYIEAFKLLKFSDWNVQNRPNVILNNVDYLCKGIKAEVLRGNISEVVLSVTINGGGGRKRSVSHPGVTIWWPIYISRGFSARPLNVK